jgi:hypothetical protein
LTSTDAFALRNSDLNAFLFADVGTELNGSPLTMLSVLARLGQDPWTEATRWTNLPKAAAIDCMARSIGQMPLDPRALADKTATASRLILLLPMHSRPGGNRIGVRGLRSGVPNWIPIAFLCLSLLLGLAFNETSAPVNSAGAIAPMTRSTNQPAAIASK